MAVTNLLPDLVKFREVLVLLEPEYPDLGCPNLLDLFMVWVLRVDEWELVTLDFHRGCRVVPDCLQALAHVDLHNGIVSARTLSSSRATLPE